MSEEKEVNSVMKKLLEARGIIKKSKLKKKGRNRYSDYDYFTPDQVSQLVDKACQDVGLISIFSLERDEIGYYGRLTTLDVNTGHSIESIMRTEIPEIKATNATQKMGGAYTYTKRYMLMNEYDIADNSLDFDAQDNRSSKEKGIQEARPNNLLKKKLHKSSENKERTNEDVAEETMTANKDFDKEAETAPEEPTELELLRAKADEYGLAYTGRHKEAGLKKMIDEHEADLKSLAEEVEDAVMEPDVSQYIEQIKAYTDLKKLSVEAKFIYNEAKENGLKGDDLDAIKEAANEHFTFLKRG